MTPLGKIVLRLSDVLDSGSVIGSTYRDDEAPAVFFNPLNIVAHASVTNDAYHEVTEAVIKQGFDGTWRHEREHLLRLLDPKSAAEDRELKIKEVATSLISQQLIFWGSYCFCPVIREDPFREGIRLIVTAGLSVTESHLITKALWYYLWNNEEEAARTQRKRGKNLPGLFDFQFEK